MVIRPNEVLINKFIETINTTIHHLKEKSNSRSYLSNSSIKGEKNTLSEYEQIIHLFKENAKKIGLTSNFDKTNRSNSVSSHFEEFLRMSKKADDVFHDYLEKDVFSEDLLHKLNNEIQKNDRLTFGEKQKLINQIAIRKTMIDPLGNSTGSDYYGINDQLMIQYNYQSTFRETCVGRRYRQINEAIDADGDSRLMCDFLFFGLYCKGTALVASVIRCALD